MPTVPGVPLGSRTVGALPVVQQRGVDPDPMQPVAAGLQRAANTLDQVQQEELRRVNETRVLEADSALSLQASSLLTDPEKGAFAKMGKNAIGITPTTLAEWEKGAAALMAGLSPEQKRLLAPRRAQTRESLQASLSRHELTQRKQYELETADAAVDIAIQRGLDDPFNLQALGQAEGKIRSEIERRAALAGDGADTVTVRTTKALTSLYGGAIGAMLARDDLSNAERLFQAVESKLDPDVRRRVQDALSQQTMTVKAQAGFDALRAEFGGDARKMREAARQRFSGELEDKVIRYVDYQQGVDRAQRAEAEAARNRAERATADAIRAKAFRGAALSPREVEFAATNGLLPQVEALQLHRSTGHPPLSDPQVWARLQAMTPEVYAQQDENALRTVLSERAFSEFVKTKRAILGGSRDVSLASVQGSPAALTLRAARGLGLVPEGVTTDKLPKDAAERYEAFSSTVDQLREQRVQQLGRSLQPSEFRDVLDEAKRGVLTRDSWGPGETTAYVTQIAADDRGDWRVPLAAIAPARQQKYQDAIGRVAALAGSAGLRVTQGMVERMAALDARGLLVVPTTPADAKALLERVNP